MAEEKRRENVEMVVLDRGVDIESLDDLRWFCCGAALGPLRW